MNREARWHPELIAFLFGSAFFTWCMASGVLWMHVGELAAAAANLGSSHPPGHPAHALLGKLVSFLPIGEVATRLSLLSALAASATLAGVVALIRGFFPQQRAMAFLVALPVAVGPGILLTATRPDVYAPTFALLIWSHVYALRCIRSQGARTRDALVATLLQGFALGFQPGIALASALPCVIAMSQVTRRRPRRVFAAVGPLLAVTGLLYLYGSMRGLASAPPQGMWTAPSSLDTFWNLLASGSYPEVTTWSWRPQRLLAALTLASEGPGLVLALIGLAGLGFGALTQLRGAGTLLASSLFVLLAASIQSPLNPDLPAHLVMLLLSGAVGLAIFTIALHRALPLPDKRDWHGAILIAPMVAVALWLATANPMEFDRSDDAMQLWDESIGRMPPGPGVYIAGGTYSVFVARYERWIGGARPDIAVVTQHLANESRLRDHLRDLLRERYVSILGDGETGTEVQRLYAHLVTRGHPVWSEVVKPAPAAATTEGRSVVFHAKASKAQHGEPPSPLRFQGPVGKKVATFAALQRARFEISHGRLSAAAKAMGVEDLLGPDLLGQSPRRPSLLPYLPLTEAHFLVSESASRLVAEDLAWQLGGEQLVPVGQGMEERLHLAWRLLLTGDSQNADALLQSLGLVAQATTVPMLLGVGELQLARRRQRQSPTSSAP